MPIEYYSPISGGAIATCIMQSGKHLIARGHDVTVLTRINGDEMYSVGRVVRIDAKSRDDLPFIMRRVSYLHWRFRCFDWPYFEYYLRSVVGELKKLKPVPDVITLYNDLVSPKFLKRYFPASRIVVWLQNEWRTRSDIRDTSRSTDLFVACSEYIRKWTSEHYGLDNKVFKVAHNAADKDVFFPNPARRVESRQNSPLKVLFVGRIDPNKGPDIVADAVTALRGERLDVSLSVAGGLWFYGHGGEETNPFFAILKKKMEAANATYLGHVNRHLAPDVYREHDVVCVLSRSQDPFPLVTMEAMASGCAVLASKRGGLPEACINAGVLVDPERLEEVIEALRLFATNREFLEAEKARSIRRAAQINWSKCADVLESAVA